MSIPKENFEKLNLQEILDYLALFSNNSASPSGTQSASPFGSEHSDIYSWIADVYLKTRSFTAPVADLLIQRKTPSNLYLASSHIQVMNPEKLQAYTTQLNLTGSVEDLRIRLTRFLRLSGGLNDDMKPTIPYDRYNMFLQSVLKNYRQYEEEPKNDVDAAALHARILTYRGLKDTVPTDDLVDILLLLNVYNAVMNHQIHTNNFNHEVPEGNVLQIADVGMIRANIRPGSRLSTLINKGFTDLNLADLEGFIAVAPEDFDKSDKYTHSIVVTKSLVEIDGKIEKRFLICVLSGSAYIEEYISKLSKFAEHVERADGETSPFGNILPNIELNTLASKIAQNSGQSSYFRRIFKHFLYMLPDISSSTRDLTLLQHDGGDNSDIEMPKYEFHLAALLRGIKMTPETYDLAARASLVRHTELVDFWFRPERFSKYTVKQLMNMYDNDENIVGEEYSNDQAEESGIVKAVIASRSRLAAKGAKLSMQDVHQNQLNLGDDETSHGWNRQKLYQQIRTKLHHDAGKGGGYYFKREDLGLSDEFPERIYIMYFYLANPNRGPKISRHTLDMLYRMLFKKDIVETAQKESDKVVGLSAHLKYELETNGKVEERGDESDEDESSESEEERVPFRSMTSSRPGPSMTLTKGSDATPVGSSMTTGSFRDFDLYKQMMSQRYPGTSGTVPTGPEFMPSASPFSTSYTNPSTTEKVPVFSTNDDTSNIWNLISTLSRQDIDKLMMIFDREVDGYRLVNRLKLQVGDYNRAPEKDLFAIRVFLQRYKITPKMVVDAINLSPSIAKSITEADKDILIRIEIREGYSPIVPVVTSTPVVISTKSPTIASRPLTPPSSTTQPITSTSQISLTSVPSTIQPITPTSSQIPVIQPIQPVGTVSPQPKREFVQTIPGVGPQSKKNILEYPGYTPPLVFLSRGDIVNYSPDLEQKGNENPTELWHYFVDGKIIMYDPQYQDIINQGYFKDGYAEIQEGSNGFGILGRLGNPDSYSWVHIRTDGVGMRVYPPKSLPLSVRK